MASIIDELAIAIFADTKQAIKGMADVDAAMGKTEEKAKKAMSNTEKAVSNATSKMGLAFVGLATTVLAAFGSVKTFNDYIDKGDALAKMSLKTGIAASELDAWGKAAEAAGGSAQALHDSLASFYAKTGRPAEEFFKLGQKIEGMSEAQARRFLQAQGVALDAVPIFLKGQKEADRLYKKYRATAFTAQDVKSARAFKNAMLDFKVASEAVGNALVRIVLPPITKLINGMASLVDWCRENSRFLGIFGGAAAVAFGIQFLPQIKAAIMAAKAFGLTLTKAMLPVLGIAAAVAALALAIDDLIGFANGQNSVFEDMLRTLGMTDAEVQGVRNSFKEFGTILGNVWDAAKPLVGDALAMGLKVVVGVVKMLAIAFTAIVATITKVVAGIKEMVSALANSKIGAILGKVGSFLGIGSTQGDDVAKNAPVVARNAALGASAPNMTTNAQLSVTNNFASTPNNPQAVANAVGGAVTTAGTRQANMVAQSANGVNLVGGY